MGVGSTVIGNQNFFSLAIANNLNMSDNVFGFYEIFGKTVADQSDNVFLLQNIEAHRAIMFLTHNLEGHSARQKRCQAPPAAAAVTSNIFKNIIIDDDE